PAPAARRGPLWARCPRQAACSSSSIPRPRVCPLAFPAGPASRIMFICPREAQKAANGKQEGEFTGNITPAAPEIPDGSGAIRRWTGTIRAGQPRPAACRSPKKAVKCRHCAEKEPHPMFEQILADNGTKFAVAAVVVLLGLLCLALVLWIVRGRPSSPFIRGGRNRTPRLAVLDAAAIDTRRRLVLVRRDDVEHLVMIGGPTDIVIESRIVSAAAETAPAAEKPVEKAQRAEPSPAVQ